VVKLALVVGEVRVVAGSGKRFASANSVVSVVGGMVPYSSFSDIQNLSHLYDKQLRYAPYVYKISLLC
jgi:hypothetical protein